VRVVPTTLRVAALQVTSVTGEPERNLDNAARFVADARAGGAKLVLCPEFLAPGYVYEETIWDFAEPRAGLTESWLSEQARRHDIVIGATFLEAQGEDFYNTFSLFGPDGLLGRARKGSLPFFEGWFFTPCPLPKVIESPVGRLGVGICNDNQTAAFLRQVADEQPDLLLMPHSAPIPRLPLVGKAFHAVMDEQLRQTPVRFARALGIPVVMANKVSREPERTKIPLIPLIRVPLAFRGYSAICDSDGSVLEQSLKREGALIADVQLDPARKRSPVVPERGYWSFPPASFAGGGGRLLDALDALGRRAYGKNRRRRAAARRIAKSAPSEM
jgi:N-carbamoylputrescine amidase